MIVKKAVIPVAGLGTRFLPISKTIPKEFLPLNAKPVIQYVVENALEAGIKEFIFVISPQKRKIFERYAKEHFVERKGELIKILKERGKKEEILKLKQIPKIKWKVAIQKKPKGDGDAILKAEKFIGKREPFLVLFGDDISFGRKSFASQLVEVFEKYRKPILCLYKLQKSKLRHYGVPKVKRIRKKIYKILDLVEKPKGTPPSDFAIVGNYLLTPEIFKFLKKTPSFRGEIILLETLKTMLKENKEILGVEVEGKWLECGDLKRWVKSFLFIAKREKI
jgi:UTP--glucose-1-phosphate uridylyltransferase